ncbi:OR1L8 protein, partial [Polypterus senegalus]
MNQTSVSVSEFVLLCTVDSEKKSYAIAILTMVYVVTLLGNILVLLVIAINPQLQKPMFVAIATLAVIDLIGSTNVIPQLIAILSGQDIKKSEKANEKATAKAHERLKQEMKQANECLRQEIQQANERLRQEVQLELRQVLGKIEERIEKNSAKLSTLADRLEHLSETFTNRIEIANI